MSSCLLTLLSYQGSQVHRAQGSTFTKDGGQNCCLQRYTINIIRKCSQNVPRIQHADFLLLSKEEKLKFSTFLEYYFLPLRAIVYCKGLISNNCIIYSVVKLSFALVLQYSRKTRNIFTC